MHQKGEGTVGQQAPIRNFHTKITFYWKILIFKKFWSKIAFNGSKARLFDIINDFFSNKYLWKDLSGVGSFLYAVGWPEIQLKCKQKNTCWKILFLSILGLELLPVAQNPAFLTYFMNFF